MIGIKVLQYEILRDVVTDAKIPNLVKGEPKRVVTLIDEQDFLRDNVIVHNVNGFLEDRVHDWMMKDGKLHYQKREKPRRLGRGWIALAA